MEKTPQAPPAQHALLADEERVLRRWLASFPLRRAVLPLPEIGAPLEAYQQPLFAKVTEDLELLKDLFGYEAVYYGIGCVVFPDAVDPRQEHTQ